MGRGWLFAGAVLLGACVRQGLIFEGPEGGSDLEAPKALQEPKILQMHGDRRVDPFYWMRDREDPRVLDYLRAENTYLKKNMSGVEDLRAQLFEELKSRIEPDESSVPLRRGDFWYQYQYREGFEHPLYLRRPKSPTGEPELLIDLNQLAEGENYFQATGLRVSPNHQILALGVDTVGRRQYVVKFKDLRSGEFLAAEIAGTTGQIAWAQDSETVFFVRRDPETLRPNQVFRVHLREPEKQSLVFEESDPEFATSIYNSKSGDFVFIISYSTETTETQYLRASDPQAAAQVVSPRRRSHHYFVEHRRDSFLIRSNHEAKNFRLMKSPISPNQQPESWEEILPHQPQILLESFSVFDDFLAIEEKTGGLDQIRIHHFEDPSKSHLVKFDEEVFSAHLATQFEMKDEKPRILFSSLAIPERTYAYDVQSRQLELLKEKKIMGDFDSTRYESKRLWATARDGTRIPVSLVYRKDRFQSQQPQALLLLGYGAYGISYPISFQSSSVSLLDRGLIVAIAHVRGGQEMGREWYEQGRLHNKMNSFTDFIDVAEFLISENYTRPDKLAAQGGSAGGLLMGAVINMRPELFRAVVAVVPFVDVVTTMLDESIPLTTGEYDEWGNPNEIEFYRTILSYSPYDQVTEQSYPALLVTSGLHDSQVQFWEPTKWVAKLRLFQQGEAPILLYTDLEAGHGGKSGRFKALEDQALRLSFILRELDAR